MLIEKGNLELEHNIVADRESVKDLIHTKGNNIGNGVEGLRRD